MCTWVRFTRSINHVSSPIVITINQYWHKVFYGTFPEKIEESSFLVTRGPTYTTFGGSSTGRARPCLNFFLKIYFWKFRQHYTHKLYCNQHAMFTMCILFSTITNKAKAMCEGASEPSPDLKNYTAPGPRSPVLKFLDPPLVHHFPAKGNFPQSSSVGPLGTFK